MLRAIRFNHESPQPACARSRRLLALGALLVACTGEIQGSPSRARPAASIDAGGAGNGPTSPPLDCGGTADTGFAPLARLTRTEYDNIVRDALGDDSSPAANFVSDDMLGLFEANIAASVGDTLVSSYLTSAEAIAASVVKSQLASILPCTATQADASCPQTLVETLGKRLYRRPLEASEVTSYLDLFELGSRASGFAHGAELVLEAMLQSPYFLYHVEVGVGAGPVQQLTPYELAARLSFFLWESMPDEALLKAADASELGTTGEVEAQARRMVQDERTAAMVRRFYRQWLRVAQLDHRVTDPALASSMGQELDAFIDQVTWKEGGTLNALFNSRSAFLDENTRKFYGVNDPGAPAAPQKPYQLAASQRAGLLTRGPFLAANVTVPARGKFVMNQLLCNPVPDPDPALMVQPIAPDPQAPERTQWATHESSPVCKGCHGVLDPVGFGFLHYDRAGQYRAQDRTFPIDATGTLNAGQPGVDGPYDGAIELSKRLSQADAVESCLTDIWFTVALDRLSRDQDRCAKARILRAFHDAHGSVPELLVALATSDAFSHRRTASP